MLNVKVYEYNSLEENKGYRGQEYSQFVLQPSNVVEDITRELDTYELTLAGLNTNKEFTPQSKFIIDVIENGEEEPVATYHFCVSRDVVEQPILSDNNYFNHHLFLIEPSVVAQTRLVDNISVTYKLKDVSLQELPAFPQTQVLFNIQSSVFTPNKNFGSYVETVSGVNRYYYVWGKYFQVEGSPYIITPSGTRKNLVYVNISDFEDDGNYYARFEIPKIAIYAGVPNGKTFSKIGYASLDYLIEEFDVNDQYNPTNSWAGSIISNSNLIDPVIGAVSEYNGEWLLEKTTVRSDFGSYSQNLDYYYKKYTDVSVQNPTYITEQFPIQSDKLYKVTVSLHLFSDNLPQRPSSFSNFYKYTDPYPTYYAFNYMYTWIDIIGTTPITRIGYESSSLSMDYQKATGSFNFISYSIDTKTIIYASSLPYSALALLQKAIINSALYQKSDGTYIADINNSDLPFYIDENYIDKLSATLIVENFYNQKNLWEVMLEVGNYIHAIPELKFGRDDKFMITFNELGRTDQKTNKSNRVSIFNSRSVEDYVCATSSYITNMVQLGGLIEEWVVPKTTSETLLVSNDTAEILTSKPIIELVGIIVKSNTNNYSSLGIGQNDTADLTPFIYEENVYKTLSLEYNSDPNRGIAMYYKLGTNTITGGNYRLPQDNENIYSDYTFKKVIYSAFLGYSAISPKPITGYWSNIKVNDFSFFVRYRTKDSVRQNHVRPDVRKYIVNSKYDEFPQHNQFNNQTDVVVDSIKFGNNMYGSLIKTGNLTITDTEWNESFENIKHKGELYEINGEKYYVAKAKHYFHSSHILSEITYSKDYNELSKVVGIPSEPRFYEISEQSLIHREFAINDILLLTDKKNQLNYGSNFVYDFTHLGNLVFGKDTDFAKYAITVFKGDKDVNSYNQTGGQAEYYKEIFNAVNAYSSENTLTYEWDMLDNYSAGDKVIDVSPQDYISQPDLRAYRSLRAVSYTDIYGKAALLDFYLIGDIGNLSEAQQKAIPESPIKTQNNIDDTRPFISNYDILGTNVLNYDTNYYGRGIGLLKDCREAISVNFNLQLITNSDTFVLSPYIFLPNKKDIKLVLLADEVNKLSTGYIDNSKIITPYDLDDNEMNPYFEFSIHNDTETSSWDNSKEISTNFGIMLSNVFANVNPKHFNGTEGYQRVKAIAIICNVSLNAGDDTQNPTIPYKTQFVIARNIPNDWDKAEAIADIWVGAPAKNAIFRERQ